MTIDSLEKYFTSATLPEGPIKLAQGQAITDPKKFVDSHLQTIKANPKNSTYLPYKNRLIKLMEILQR